MDAMALMQPDWKVKLSDIVFDHLDSLRDNPLVIIVATSATEGLVDIVHELKNRVDSVIAVLLDVASYGGRQAASDIARTLMWHGAQVYIVRKGEDLTAALDSRHTRVHPLTVQASS
jgi:hypothetical protein